MRCLALVNVASGNDDRAEVWTPVTVAPRSRCNDWFNAAADLETAGLNATIARPSQVIFCASCAAMPVVNEGLLPQAVTEAQQTTLRTELPGLQEEEEQALGFALARHLRALFRSTASERT